jgi:hypothetical protein
MRRCGLAAALTEQGYVALRGVPYSASAVKSMVSIRPAPQVAGVGDRG